MSDAPISPRRGSLSAFGWSVTDDYNDWVGSQDIGHDLLDAGLLNAWRSTMDYEGLAPSDIPLGVHWCLAPMVLPNRDLGVDGHPKKGGFLPPIPLPRRMWAGGEVRFVGELKPGDAVERRSRVARVERKTGRAGDLWFVTVEHTWSNADGVAIDERQDIVYLAPSGTSRAAAQPQNAETETGDWHVEIACSNVSLFRFSAMTFNSHRIHYDLKYAVEQEGYAGLVVHGPLQAALLLNYARQVAGKGTPSTFAFRGVSPLILGAPFRLHAKPCESGLDLWAASSEGVKTMTARALWPQ